MEHARAQYLRAKGEHRSLWPSVDFAAQYANLATYNNYDRFYQPGSFQPNNATVGVAIHFPFLNSAQHERVQEAESEAFKATKQAEAARNQVSEETLRLQRSVTQMQAARDVADLEYEIAQKNIEAVRTRMESSAANLHDLDNARTQASERLITLQDVTFELERSQVALMRATGDLESWALGNEIVRRCLFSTIRCIKPVIRRRTCINTGFSTHEPCPDGKISTYPICLLKHYS